MYRVRGWPALTETNSTATISELALRNVSTHLSALTKDVAQIEMAISSLHDEDVNLDDEALVNLQRIDLVLQTLHDLATLTRLMAHGDATPDRVAQALKLAATQALVADMGSYSENEPGDFDLF